MDQQPLTRNSCVGSHIPLWVKLAYSGFVAVLVPYYLHTYGPTNFLYFCDVAVLMALVAVWREDALWASMPAVGILMPQALWMVDFLGGLLGLHVVGMTAYMFDPVIPLFARGLSLFHFWLPLFLVWLVWRLGYDRRALVAWTVVAWMLILVCYFLMPAPPAPTENPNLPVNINYVYGLSDAKPQQWMPPLVYLGLMMIILPICLFLPTHLVLRRVFRESHVRSRDVGSPRSSNRPERPFPPFTEAPPTRCERASRILLKTAGIVGPLASLVVLSLAAWIYANSGRQGLVVGGWPLFLSAVFVWIPAHVLAGCLFLCGLGTQIYAGRGSAGWTAWNAIYFLSLPLVYALFVFIWP